MNNASVPTQRLPLPQTREATRQPQSFGTGSRNRMVALLKRHQPLGHFWDTLKAYVAQDPAENVDREFGNFTEAFDLDDALD